MAYLNVNNDGTFSTFSPELSTNPHPLYGDFCFGDIRKDRIRDIFNNPKFNLINSEIQAGVEKCKNECEYFVSCGGGTPSNKVHENNTFDCTETNFCRLSEQIYAKIVLEDFENLINPSTN